MNMLPEGAIPKLYRQRTKDGKEVGAWYCPKVKGKISKPVNLRTQDYFKARERSREALNGRKDFPDDRYFDDGGVPKPPKDAPVVDDWAADAQSAAKQSVEPDAYFSPGDQPMAALNAKPASPPAPGGAPAVTPEPPKTTSEGTQIPPEMMEGFIKQIANTLVELQIHGQEYLWIRAVKVNPGAVPLESDARKIPATIWESQLKKWLPTDIPLPEWVAAIGLTVMMAGTVQFQGATPLRPDQMPQKATEETPKQ